jgi:hypothetical protein
MHDLKNKIILSKIAAKTCGFPDFETLKTVKNRYATFFGSEEVFQLKKRNIS